MRPIFSRTVRRCAGALCAGSRGETERIGEGRLRRLLFTFVDMKRIVFRRKDAGASWDGSWYGALEVVEKKMAAAA